MSRYTVFFEEKAFYTEYFDLKQSYVTGMIIFDNFSKTFFNGEKWQPIEQDHL